MGDRWTLLIYRDLAAGKRRFESFLESKEGIATNVLADRLKRLEQHKLIASAPDPADRRRVVYRLTARGKSLGPVMLALRDWGLAHLPGTSAAEFERTRRAYAEDAT